MPDETVITWDQVRLAARQNLKQWAEERQMPLYRRRESVTADEVIRHLKERHRGFGVEFIEAAIEEICGKNAIENEQIPANMSDVELHERGYIGSPRRPEDD